jgi:Flp pilus assembly protein TadB
MEEQDVMKLDESERRLLDLSFQSGLDDKRVRSIVINSVLACAAVIIAAVYRMDVGWLGALTVAILVISAFEKVSYCRTALHYKTMVQKLVHRVEQLEGTPSTALGSHPAAALERKRALDQPHAQPGHA